jgi:16S rRNA (adenine1518-N6/adenine1519-N6)-dimethyltransferase
MGLTRPKKKWGQNFLTDKNIARKIVRAAEINPESLVIEIGPGRGALTDLLLDSGASYLGVEIDPQLAEELRSRFATNPDFALIQQDFLEADLSGISKRYPRKNPLVIGNIPYNITSPIVFKLFDDADILHSAILMVQKEVAERLKASPGTKEYGLLAINARLFADVKYLFTVPAKLFFPKPKVDSALIKFIFKKEVQRQFADFQLFRTISRHCFQHRRKMLRKSLSVLFSSRILSKLSFNLTRRPESLSVQEWVTLTESICRLLQEEREL